MHLANTSRRQCIRASCPGWFRSFRLLLAVLLAGVAACAERGAFPEFGSQSGREYLQNALSSVETGMGADAEALLILARFRNELGEAEEAERLARLALEREPNRAETHLFLANLLIRQDRMEEAKRLLREAVRIQPGIPGGQRRLGMVLDRLGDREGAREAFEIAIRLLPRDATARLLLGRLLLDDGDAQAASVHLERACQLDPQLAGAYYALAQAQTRLEKPEAARESLKTFQQLKAKEKAELDAKYASPNDEKVVRLLAAAFHTDIAGLLLRRQQGALAEKHLRQAVRIAPQDPRGHEMLASLLLRSGRLSEARKTCEALVRLNPRQAAYRVNLGTLLLQLKEFPAAVAELQRALELDPDQPQALHNLARFYLGARRDLPEALAMARRLVARQPAAESYDLLGWALFANGRIDEARAAAAEAVKRDPDSAVYRERYRRLKEVP